MNANTVRLGFVAAVLAASPLLKSPAEAQDSALISAAKKEKQIVWYTVQTVNQVVRPIVAAFEKKYGIKVNYVRANSSDVTLRILAEARAGKVLCDVFDGTTTAPPLKRANLVEKWLPPQAGYFKPQTIDKDGYWIATNFFVNTLAINTDLVKPTNEPKSFDQLLDPKWKDRMAWGNTPSSSAGPGFIGLMIKSMGREKALDFLKKLAKQNIAGMPVAARQVLNRVIAGEYAIGINMFNHHTIISAAKGAPVKWLPISPGMVTMATGSLMKNAPHPNAGKLFLSFLVSEDGQRIFAANNYLPAHPNVPPKVASLIPDGVKFKGIFFTPEESDSEMPQWQKIFREYFR